MQWGMLIVHFEDLPKSVDGNEGDVIDLGNEADHSCCNVVCGVYIFSYCRLFTNTSTEAVRVDCDCVFLLRKS
jgi:hypothetical protein